MRGSTPLSRSMKTIKVTMKEIRQVKEYKINQDNERIALGDVNSSSCELDPIEEAKILIIDKITKHFSDFIFEMVNEKMSENYLFQAEHYLTDAGYDEFEDEWFEFYHEHHGDIMYEVMKNITN